MCVPVCVYGKKENKKGQEAREREVYGVEKRGKEELISWRVLCERCACGIPIR